MKFEETISKEKEGLTYAIYVRRAHLYLYNDISNTVGWNAEDEIDIKHKDAERRARPASQKSQGPKLIKLANRLAEIVHSM